MNDGHRTLVVDPTSSGKLFAERLIAHGYDVDVLFTTPIPEPFVAGAKEVREVVGDARCRFVDMRPGDWTDSDCEAVIRGAWGYVVAGAESGIAAADHARELLGLHPRNDFSVRQARYDKFAAQKTLESRGLSHVKSRLVVSPNDVQTVEEYPVIVKPVDSAGTDGVCLVNGHAELSEYVTAALGSTNAMCRDISSLVIQEVVQGDEYVVDGAVVNGIPTAISVGVYRKTWSQGFPVYKSLTWLTEHEVPRYGELIEYLRECLGALGVRVGCFHFEAFDRGSEWTMMEVGLRPHGGGHPLYTETLTGGISQVSVELATCLGGEVAIDGLPRLGIRGRVVFFAVDQQSTVISDPRERIGSAPYVLESHIAVSPGDAVTPPKSLFDTFALGFAVITGDTWDELETREVNVRALFAGCFSAAV